VAYEAAIEAINGAVGAYTALIGAEEARPEPDQRAIAAAGEGRAGCARWREQLDPADRAAVAFTLGDRHLGRMASSRRSSARRPGRH
jgi:hypothetical protein